MDTACAHRNREIQISRIGALSARRAAALIYTTVPPATVWRWRGLFLEMWTITGVMKTHAEADMSNTTLYKSANKVTLR